MSAVGRLRALGELVPAIREATVGSTGYIDDPCMPPARLSKGVDRHGRIFLTLCLRSEGRDDRRVYEGRGVVTVFQRYSDDTLVTQAKNTHLAPDIIHAAATDEELAFLERLVADGQAERTIEGVIGGTLREKMWIVEPAEALALENP